LIDNFLKSNQPVLVSSSDLQLTGTLQETFNTACVTFNDIHVIYPIASQNLHYLNFATSGISILQYPSNLLFPEISHLLVLVNEGDPYSMSFSIPPSIVSDNTGPIEVIHSNFFTTYLFSNNLKLL